MDTLEITEIFKQNGLKLTPQRIAVYGFLKEHPIHPDALTVYESLVKTHPSFSKTTVYNCLQTLTDCGLLSPVCIDKSKIRYDADTSFHGHFQCVRCGKIYDFKCSECQTEGLEDFETTQKGLYYSGICSHCKK